MAMSALCGYESISTVAYIAGGGGSNHGGQMAKHRRDRKALIFWRANPHPFIPRRTRAKDCSRCDYGKTNAIHTRR